MFNGLRHIDGVGVVDDTIDYRDKALIPKFFNGEKRGRLGKVKTYDNPLELSDYGIKAAPQSFVYINA